jgi:hypothetical protein
MRKQHIIAVFLLTTILAGVGGLGGSILGHAFGTPGLYAGGLIGGVVLVIAAAKLCAAFKWIPGPAFPRTAIGGSIGFLAAAAIAVNTLSSPVGPFIASLLTGLGAVLGARTAGTRDTATTTGP